MGSHEGVLLCPRLDASERAVLQWQLPALSGDALSYNLDFGSDTPTSRWARGFCELQDGSGVLLASAASPMSCGGAGLWWLGGEADATSRSVTPESVWAI